ncbi:hypothetical protein TCAL_06296 [Tigriopus californicus]|uniref:Integrase zinc-binding domain-containing protein n=1 Tax=Tigriopus californicus TaxID=6832 RepID=A0A553PRD5_TIGCA|nr:hypothetical protein TCAL_06296 [Tigriopus californicus]|eukprot:TCALIF_06296-PA protein Name:"Protein of unknown function" AED:0.71 eAED:0.71 QI:0/0/0/0.25/1/1/4/0/315
MAPITGATPTPSTMARESCFLQEIDELGSQRSGGSGGSGGSSMGSSQRKANAEIELAKRQAEALVEMELQELERNETQRQIEFKARRDDLIRKKEFSGRTAEIQALNKVVTGGAFPSPPRNDFYVGDRGYFVTPPPPQFETPTQDQPFLPPEVPSVILKGSPPRSLSPFLDQNDILRVRGRLNRLINEEVNPIILPTHAKVTELIVKHYHHEVAHSGREMTLNAIRLAGQQDFVKRHHHATARLCNSHLAPPPSSPFLTPLANTPQGDTQALRGKYLELNDAHLTFELKCVDVLSDDPCKKSNPSEAALAKYDKL